jgi:hypothetical protein
MHALHSSFHDAADAIEARHALTIVSVHWYAIFVFSHHLYHWQQFDVVGITPKLSVVLSMTCTVAAKPVAGGGDGVGGGNGEGGFGEGGGGDGGGWGGGAELRVRDGRHDREPHPRESDEPAGARHPALGDVLDAWVRIFETKQIDRPVWYRSTRAGTRAAVRATFGRPQKWRKIISRDLSRNET